MDTLSGKVDKLGGHPFKKISDLLSPFDPDPSHEVIDLTIGEPQFIPSSIKQMLREFRIKDSNYRKYPPNSGTEEFSKACLGWLQKRYSLNRGQLSKGNIIPTAGAREALFQLGLLEQYSERPQKICALPVPHYAPYRALPILHGLSPLWLLAEKEHGYLPSLKVIDQNTLKNIGVFYLCTPSNPEGVVANKDYIKELMSYARKYHWLLVFDEAYSEIYHDHPPTGALEVALNSPEFADDPLKNIAVVHSLSKRSSAAGVRVGFVVGNEDTIAALTKLRAYIRWYNITPCSHLSSIATGRRNPRSRNSWSLREIKKHCQRGV